MHDTLLIKKISEEVNELSKMNELIKVTKLVVTVNHKSHVNEGNLYDHLHHMSKRRFGPWTQIQVVRDDIQDQVAILQSLEGEKE